MRECRSCLSKRLEGGHKEQDILIRELQQAVPQDSVLAPIMFLMYANNMPDKMRSCVNPFEDDAKNHETTKNIHTHLFRQVIHEDRR